MNTIHPDSVVSEAPAGYWEDFEFAWLVRLDETRVLVQKCSPILEPSEQPIVWRVVPEYLESRRQ